MTPRPASVVLGLNAYHGDVSAAIVRDGQLIAAVEEERFRRIKHYAGFPHRAIAECLRLAGLQAADVDLFAVSRNPRAHLWRKALFLLRSTGRRGPSAIGRATSRRSDRFLRRWRPRWAWTNGCVRDRMRFVEHHPAHLASAAFVSPFDDAAVCAIDGFGDFVSTSWGRGGPRAARRSAASSFRTRSACCTWPSRSSWGFPNYGDEFKVMGLAPYGEPRYVRELESLVHLSDDGGFELDLSYFRHWSDGVAMTWEDGEPTIGPVFTPKLEALLGPARRPDEPLDAAARGDRGVAAGGLRRGGDARALARAARDRRRRLCLAGGCAMNSVANGKIREQTGFREVFIQPAAGDNGTALGAAFHAWHQIAGRIRATS